MMTETSGPWLTLLLLVLLSRSFISDELCVSEKLAVRVMDDIRPKPLFDLWNVDAEPSFSQLEH
jgi:hypothetical protein